MAHGRLIEETTASNDENTQRALESETGTYSTASTTCMIMAKSPRQLRVAYLSSGEEATWSGVSHRNTRNRLLPGICCRFDDSNYFSKTPRRRGGTRGAPIGLGKRRGRRASLAAMELRRQIATTELRAAFILSALVFAIHQTALKPAGYKTLVWTVLICLCGSLYLTNTAEHRRVSDAGGSSHGYGVMDDRGRVAGNVKVPASHQGGIAGVTVVSLGRSLLSKGTCSVGQCSPDPFLVVLSALGLPLMACGFVTCVAFLLVPCCCTRN